TFAAVGPDPEGLVRASPLPHPPRTSCSLQRLLSLLVPYSYGLTRVGWLGSVRIESGSGLPSSARGFVVRSPRYHHGSSATVRRGSRSCTLPLTAIGTTIRRRRTRGCLVS